MKGTTQVTTLDTSHRFKLLYDLHNIKYISNFIEKTKNIHSKLQILTIRCTISIESKLQWLKHKTNELIIL